MAPANEGVPPRFKTRAPRANADSTAPTEVLDVFVGVNLRCKSGYQIPFNGKPVVREIRDGRVQTNHTRVDQIGLKREELQAQTQLPTVIIAIAKNISRFRSGHCCRFGWKRIRWSWHRITWGSCNIR